ncbi:hypothetical protein BKA63DRAFT_274435 [Paraphoma chrysanthemicola]|nr:hypothetical protein BKA63DRAFT_274435 [Paraphoma chrysanthemicola]
MSVYLITGVSRGIGFAFLEIISGNPSNTVIGLVRNASETKAKIASWNRSNIHILEANLDNYDSLKKSVEAVEAITPSLDYIIANAGLVSSWSAFDPLSVLGQDPTRLTTDLTELFSTNVIGQIHLINLYMPLILKGKVKKIIAISTGLADLDITSGYGLHEAAPYSASKAALNMVIAKFDSEWRKQGVLLMGVAPGAVEVGRSEQMTPEEMAKGMAFFGKFQQYASGFQGPTTPEVSVDLMLKVIENASIEKGDGGAFVSQFGNKQWL